MQLVGLYILRPFEISVPVPAGEEKKAQEIVKKLGGSADEEDVVAGPEPGRCMTCGASMSPGEGFCESCGAKAADGVPKTSEPSLRCPSCGMILKPEAKFCRSCGYKRQ